MKNDDPPLKCLTAFDATVRLESMTAAARELGTTKPAITALMRKLLKALWYVGQGEAFDEHHLFGQQPTN